MGANGKDDDGRDDSWPWNDKWLKSIKEEHDKFFAELKDQSRRLEKELRNDDNTNSNSPFAAFKKFIDSNFNALTDGFKNFPSNIAELRAKMQREQERLRQEELDISRRWTGSDDTPDHIQLELLRSTDDERQDAYKATMMLLTEAQRQNAHVSKAKIEALFSDPENMLGYLDRLASPMLALGGAWYYMPETGDKLPTADSWRWLSPQPRWLSVDWFKRSPYSPIRLEAHPDLGMHGAKWRAAFEDLMNATLDKPMHSMERVGMRTPYGKPQSTLYGPGLEWLLSLQCRGILPPLLPRAYNDDESTKELRDTSIMAAITRHKTDLSLKNEQTIQWRTSLHKDITDLMSEVATKATSNTEAEPIPNGRPYKVIMPASEQDLYESPYVMGLQDAEEPSDSAVAQSSNASVGSNEDEDENFDLLMINALLDAMDGDDVQTATDVINDWYETHGDVDELLWKEFERVDVLSEAVRNSTLPESDRHKLAAYQRGTMTAEEPDEETVQNLERKLKLMKRAHELTGESFKWPAWVSLQELEEFVARLEQEHENLERMVGNKAEEKQAVPQKPEVLSALTTTETTRLPDGTVTTKVVLKKRFADGREETSESVHTANEALEQKHQQNAQEEKPEKKKGWFWS